MAKNRLIETSIWNDAWFNGLTADAKLLFIHILTSPMTKESGFLECPDSLLVTYLYPINRLEKARQELKPKILFDKKYNLYLMANFYLKNCKSPKMIKPALNDLNKYSKSFLVSCFLDKNCNIQEFQEFKEKHKYPIDTLSIGCSDNDSDSDNENKDINSFSLNKESEKKSKNEYEQYPDFVKFWDLYQKGSKANAFEQYLKIKSDFPIDIIIKHIENYFKNVPEIRYRKDGERYIKSKYWETNINFGGNTNNGTNKGPNNRSRDFGQQDLINSKFAKGFNRD